MTGAATIIAAAAALALTAFAVVGGTWAVGGSDSSCYALMAEAFAQGSLQPVAPLASEAPWPNAATTFAPAGFIPSPVRPAAAAPICTAGFSLLLVPFRLMGGADGIFFLTPLAAGLLVWCAFVSTRQLAGAGAGAAAAVITATTAIVLFQAVQPMNDITATALWLAVFALSGIEAPRRWWLMGVLTGFALLVRPNLAPVAAAAGVWTLIQGGPHAALRFGAGAAPGALVMGWLNAEMYGSPFRVGYGSAAALFSAGFVPANVARYSRSALETLTPFPLIALAAPFVLGPQHRARAWLGLAMIAATVAVYLPYQSFQEWWYLRFLLPAIAVAIVLATATATPLVRGRVAIAAIAVVLAGFGLATARQRQAFELQRLESRFRHAGAFVRERLPENAVLLTVWQSGTIRYHAHRETILWDSMDPAALDGAIDWLRTRGREPFLLLERWEEPRFRERFAGAAALGALDWPPRFEIDRQVRVYAPADRGHYLAGEAVSTEYIWPR
jgi:hypothetical protein